MVWSELRERLVYVAMSAFVVWHTLAIMVAPASDNSRLVQGLRAVFDPYLALFRIDSKWNFYAPDVGRGHQVRYVVEDSAGTRQTFIPTDEWSWHHPGYWWFRAWNEAVLTYPDIYADAVIASLCERHTALKPAAITLLVLVEQAFTPEDHLRGKHPLDPEFVTEHELRQGQCPPS